MKKNSKKLQLKNDTIRRLQSTQLARAAGGGIVTTIVNTHCNSCESICTTDTVETI